MVEAAREGVALTGLDGTVTEVNGEAVRMFGFGSEDEPLGRNALEFIAGRDRKRVAVDMQQIRKQGEVRYIDCTLIRPDGTECPGEIRASMKRDACGNPVGLIALIRDITERKQAVRAAEEARQYAESIVATVREPLLVLDADLRVVSANRSFYQTFQVTAEETRGQLLYNLGNRQWDIPLLRELLEELLPKNATFEDFSVENDFPAIGRKTMLLNARRIYKEANKTQMILLAIEDVTELKLMQEKLIASGRLAALGQLSGSISHELRNPLAIIDSSVYYLKTKLRDTDGKVQEHLKRIKSGVDNATTIIQSLLDLTRMNEPQLARLDLRAITSEAIAAARVPAGVRVMQDFPEQELGVNADPRQLSMAFKNIVGNAVEAMEGQGTLRVTARSAADGRAEVSFADTGPGIPPEDLDRIFEPLFSTKARGIGFGLSIARMIIDRHGGTIEARSEPGRGATIAIRLPLNMGEPKEE